MFGAPSRFQTEELYHVIEGQNDTMAKLREMLHQSQLGQLHVCESHLRKTPVDKATRRQSSQLLSACPPYDSDFPLFSGLRGNVPSSATGGSA